MNIHDEEWGEERLVESIGSADGGRPEAIVEAVFRSADEFAGEAPQHDDMTIVVLAVGQSSSPIGDSVQELVAK